MTNWTVTLKALRKAGACVDGYNKLVCHISGKTFDPERETYIRFKHDEPINVSTILESNGFEDAIWATRCVSGAERDLRLYAVWRARQVQRLMTDPRSIRAIDTAERYANGKATDAELADAWEDARAAARAATWAATWAAAQAAAWTAAQNAARAAAWADAWEDARDAARAAQREMFVAMLNGTAPWQVKGD
jgi:hypothetical protein